MTTPPLVNLLHTNCKTSQFWYLLSLMTPAAAAAIKFSPFITRMSKKRRLSSAARDTYCSHFQRPLNRQFLYKTSLARSLDRRLQHCFCTKFVNLAQKENWSFIKNEPDATIKNKGLQKQNNKTLLQAKVLHKKQRMLQLSKGKIKVKTCVEGTKNNYENEGLPLIWKWNELINWSGREPHTLT